MKSIQLKDKLRNISKEQNVNFNILLRLYMYDRLIERLSLSKYKDNFILKGGFYLSTLFGVKNRNTMDIDTAFRNEDFTEEIISRIMREIIAIKLDDNAILTYIGIESIRELDEYGGFRVTILVELENIKEKFHIDIATGDPITPKEITYKYKPILSENCINLWAYNLETVLAEKLETILSREELNGRLRDFYDIYLIYTKEWKNINLDNFRKAINNTFTKRVYNGNLEESFKTIKNSAILKQRWNAYAKKYAYANNLSYEEVINCLEEIIKVITIVST